MKPRTVGSAILIALAVAVLDYLTGFETRFEILYLVPVGLLAKSGQQRWAVIMAIAVVALWSGADIGSGHVYQQPLARYWNMIELLAAALVLALLGARRAEALAPSPVAAPAAELDRTAAYARAVMRRIEPDGTPRKPATHTSSQTR